jgi:hypothetical protein
VKSNLSIESCRYPNYRRNGVLEYDRVVFTSDLPGRRVSSTVGESYTQLPGIRISSALGESGISLPGG